MTYVPDAAAARRGGRRATAEKPGVGAPTLKVKVLLPRRALQLQSGSVRYDYRHGIARGDFLGARRVSLTFRQNKLGKHGV